MCKTAMNIHEQLQVQICFAFFCVISRSEIAASHYKCMFKFINCQVILQSGNTIPSTPVNTGEHSLVTRTQHYQFLIVSILDGCAVVSHFDFNLHCLRRQTTLSIFFTTRRPLIYIPLKNVCSNPFHVLGCSHNGMLLSTKKE